MINSEFATPIISYVAPLSRNTFARESDKSSNILTIHFLGKKNLVSVDDLIMIVSDSNYSTLYLKDGRKILTSKTLKYWESAINDNSKMIRVHHSNLVHKASIKYFRLYDKTVVLMNRMEVLCSRRMYRSLKASGDVLWA